MRSFSEAGTGRLPHAAMMPRIRFSALNGTRVPSRLTTISRSVRSTRSNVVKRLPHARHSRRRRIASPDSVGRLSITLSRSRSQ